MTHKQQDQAVRELIQQWLEYVERSFVQEAKDELAWRDVAGLGVFATNSLYNTYFHALAAIEAVSLEQIPEPHRHQVQLASLDSLNHYILLTALFEAIEDQVQAGPSAIIEDALRRAKERAATLPLRAFANSTPGAGADAAS